MPGEVIEPIGFGPIAPSWRGRAAYLYGHAAGWLHERWAEQPLPSDIDARYFNAAPPEQQVEALRVDERIVVEHLHVEHARLVTNLEVLTPRSAPALGALLLLAGLTACAAPPARSLHDPAAHPSSAAATDLHPPAPVAPPPSSAPPPKDPPPPAPTPPVAAERAYDLRDASRLHDFRLEVGPPQPPAGDDPRGPPGRLTVFRKGTTQIVQQLSIASLSERAADPRYEPSLLAEDYDFDGNEDFALHTGDAGPYGAPTYSIFVFVPASGAYALSPALSRLAETSIEPLRADATRKRLILESKSGCCIHWAEEYELHGGTPRLMKRETEAAEPDGRCVLTVETSRPGGGMKRETRRCP